MRRIMIALVCLLFAWLGAVFFGIMRELSAPCCFIRWFRGSVGVPAEALAMATPSSQRDRLIMLSW